MTGVLNVRFIPHWLKKVIEHHGGDYSAFESIVSSYDLKFYKLANYALQATLSGYDLKDSLCFPDGSVEDFTNYTTEDVRFSLYGNSNLDKSVADYHLNNFTIVPSTDPRFDVYLVSDIDTAAEAPQNLIDTLTRTAYTYKGKAALYDSALFTCYLKQLAV